MFIKEFPTIMDILTHHKISVVVGINLFVLTYLSIMIIGNIIEPASIYFTFIVFIHIVFLIISSLFIRFGFRPKGFVKSQLLISKFVNSNFTNHPPAKSLFSETMSLLANGLAMQIPSLIFIWLNYFIGNVFIYFLIPVTILFTLRILWKQQGMIIFQFLYLPVIALLLISDQYFAVNILCGTVIGALLLAKCFKSFTLSEYIKKHYKKNIFFYMYQKVSVLSQDVYSQIYNKSETVTYQSIAIVLIFLFYIGGNYIFYILPSEYFQFQADYLKFVEETKDYIPYFAFILYVGLLISSYLNVLSKPFSFKDENTSIKRGANVTVIFIFGIFVMPLFVVFAIILSAILLSVGESLLGIGFLIFIGFFVFPVWIAKLFSLILSLFLLILPEKLLHRFVK